jgi:hypothetical protein
MYKFTLTNMFLQAVSNFKNNTHTSFTEKPMDSAATSGIRSPGIGQFPFRKTTDPGDLKMLNSLPKTPKKKMD